MQSNKVFLKPLPLLRSLFFFTAVVLLTFGAGTLMRINQNPGRMNLYLVYAMMMFVDSAAMFVCGLLIARKRKPFFWLAAWVVGLNILMTIADQFGVVDFLFLLLNIMIFVFLFKTRREFAS